VYILKADWTALKIDQEAKDAKIKRLLDEVKGLREAGNTSDPLYQNWVMGNRDFVANKKRFEEKMEKFQKLLTLPQNKLINKLLDLMSTNEELLKENKYLRERISNQSEMKEAMNRIHELSE
jgi:hypothetical protein